MKQSQKACTIWLTGLSGAGNSSKLSAAIQAGDRPAALALLKQPAEVKALDARAEGTTLTVDLVYRVRASEETRRLRFEHDMRTLGDA